MHVGKPVAAMHGVDRHHHIVGIAGQRIDRTHGDHAANLEIGIDSVPGLHRQRAGHQLIVRRLVHDLLAILARLIVQPRVSEGRKVLVEVGLVVDLVKGHPVLHFLLVTSENGFGKADKERDRLPVAPAAVFGHQVVRHLKVREGNNGFDVVLQALVEEIVIELQPGFVRLQLIPAREDACPGDGGTEAFKAHLRKQLNVLRVAMVKVDAFMVGVVFPLEHAFGNFPRHAVSPGGHHVGNADPFAPLLPATLKLMRGDRPAPEKICFKSRHLYPPLRWNLLEDSNRCGRLPDACHIIARGSALISRSGKA